MDYLEIMDFCGYDLKAADKMAQEFPPCVIKEALDEIGLERLEPEPDRS